MKGRLLAVAGCIAAVGLIFPVWEHLEKKEADGERNYEIYQQICVLEQERDRANERITQAESENKEFLEKIRPYEEKLETVQTVKQQYQKAMDMPVTSRADVFLKVPYTLDVDGIVRSYDDTKASVGFSSVMSNLGGVIGEFIGSMAVEGTEDFAQEESTARIKLSKDLYEIVEPVEREAEEALIEYWALTGYRNSLLNTEDEGKLLSGMMILEQIGEMTEDEEGRIAKAEEQAIKALAKLDFVLNIYYDFSRDSMIDGNKTVLLLAQVSEIRNIVGQLLGNRDLSEYGYTKEEKREIVRPLIDEWVRMVDACYTNASVGYDGGSTILYSSNDWHDLNYQTKTGNDKGYPRRIIPHYAANMAKRPIWVYFNSDNNSRHKAYYVKAYGYEYYYYQTDHGEEITDYGGLEEDGEERMEKTDYVYELIRKQNKGWQNAAGHYLE